MDSKQDPPFHKCCWKPTKIGDSEWLVKSIFGNDFYEVMFSDQANIWQERLSSSDIVNRSQEINSNLEIGIQKLLEHISYGLNGCNPDVVYAATLSPSSQKLTFGIKFKLAGLPFEWLFYSSRLSTDIVRQHLTWPLMTMVVELNRQKKELVDLIKSKDREIAELKAQGATSRKKVETAVFNEELFNGSMLQSKGFANSVRQTCSTVFDTDGQQLYSNIMEAIDSQSASSSDVIDMMLIDSKEKAASSASCSATSTPTKSPVKPSPERTKETELQRRMALEQKLAEEERKECAKKKKKLKL